MAKSFSDLIEHEFAVADGIDTCADLSDEDIGRAFLENPLLAYAAQFLSKAHGRPVRRSDLAARVKVTPKLQVLLREAEEFHEQALIQRALSAIQQASTLKKARHRRDRGPRCGAQTRKGTLCELKVVLGQDRCRLHGGCSTGPKTSRGRARSRENLELRWKSKVPEK